MREEREEREEEWAEAEGGGNEEAAAVAAEAAEEEAEEEAEGRGGGKAVVEEEVAKREREVPDVDLERGKSVVVIHEHVHEQVDADWHPLHCRVLREGVCERERECVCV